MFYNVFFAYTGNIQHNSVTTTQCKRLQETQLSLTNRATRLEVSQGHQTLYHSIC